MKLNSQEIIKVLDALIGKTEAVGDSWKDDEIEQNLMMLIDITNWCLDGILFSSNTRDRIEYSMRIVGDRAYSALLDYKKWLNDVIEVEE